MVYVPVAVLFASAALNAVSSVAIPIHPNNQDLAVRQFDFDGLLARELEDFEAREPFLGALAKVGAKVIGKVAKKGKKHGKKHGASAASEASNQQNQRRSHFQDLIARTELDLEDILSREPSLFSSVAKVGAKVAGKALSKGGKAAGKKAAKKGVKKAAKKGAKKAAKNAKKGAKKAGKSAKKAAKEHGPQIASDAAQTAAQTAVEQAAPQNAPAEEQQRRAVESNFEDLIARDLDELEVREPFLGALAKIGAKVIGKAAKKGKKHGKKHGASAASDQSQNQRRSHELEVRSKGGPPSGLGTAVAKMAGDALEQRGAEFVERELGYELDELN